MTPFGFFVAAGGVTAILWLKFHHGQIGVSENEFWIGTWLTLLGAGCFVNGCCPGRPPHPVQLYESGGLLAISLVCFFLLKQVERSRLARGTSFCAYLFLYGLLRLLLDPLRTDGRPEKFWGFSYQQAFAVAFMFLAGVTILLINHINYRALNTDPIQFP